ncbi:SAG1386/EF1546 family surface-associated protein [Vagococcus elongatus]|uniref:LysM domain-containing protein n=1 Tax=Vagococcus elongatus TaxID=180344 RepID=A0A430B5H4_9ENTE|nr:SAG1386/EF1546 family surface-associated protein [Vagococcus elongatus]RSU15575.1 hypothetical protein CBF29_00430 [Vagococcus elongatus]
MDKNDNEKKPWEQPIYETEYDSNASRTQKRNKGKESKGNAGFITLLVVMLLAIALLVIFIFVKATDNRKPAAKKEDKIEIKSSVSSTKKTVESTQKTETTETAPKPEEAPAQPTPTPAPEENQPPVQEPPANQSPETPAGGVHVVQAGENLYRIALNNGLTVEQLKQMNGLSGDEVSIGQQLKVQ